MKTIKYDYSKASSNAFAKCNVWHVRKKSLKLMSCLCVLHFFLFSLSVLLSAPSSMNNPCVGTSSFHIKKTSLNPRFSAPWPSDPPTSICSRGPPSQKSWARLPDEIRDPILEKKVERSSFWCFHCKKGVRVNSVLTTVMLRKGYCRKQCSTLICI